MLDLKRWMTTKAVTKYRSVVSKALRSMNSDQWEDALKAYDELGGLIDAEMQRRLANV